MDSFHVCPVEFSLYLARGISKADFSTTHGSLHVYLGYFFRVTGQL